MIVYTTIILHPISLMVHPSLHTKIRNFISINVSYSKKKNTFAPYYKYIK